jgi:phage gpG-like protein
VSVAVHADASELTTMLRAAQRKATNLEGTMAVASEMLVTAVSDQFESAGDGRWAGLEDSTLAKRRKGGRGAQILVDTGRFAGSIQPGFGPDFAEASTDIAYAVYHCSDEPRTMIPMRNPFDVNDARLDEIEELLLTDMARAIGGGS